MDAKPSTGTILVVDDDLLIIDMLRACIEDQGYETIIATSGETAITRAEQTATDLILLDIVMTGVDGLETCRRLKASEKTSTIPVIFLTVLTDTENIVTAFKAGAADYVTKPIRIPELLARIQTQIELRHTQMALKTKNQRLQQEVEKRLEMENQIRFLNQELMRAQERERQKIAYELHEKIAQNLAALKLLTSDIFDHQRRLPEEKRKKAASFSEGLESVLHDIRAMTYQLHPQLLDIFGIERSVAVYCQDFSTRYALPVDVDCVGFTDRRFDMDTEINLYRIVQEGLDHLVQYGTSRRAMVRLNANDERILLQMENEREDAAFDDHAIEIMPADGLGLRRMQARARLLGGHLTIESRSVPGNRIVIDIPVCEKDRNGPITV
ncbi:ATP-binding response regulator [Desulfosarcina ovata]|nr:response regulator [Desulfosarcina ovata]